MADKHRCVDPMAALSRRKPVDESTVSDQLAQADSSTVLHESTVDVDAEAQR